MGELRRIYFYCRRIDNGHIYL